MISSDGIKLGIWTNPHKFTIQAFWKKSMDDGEILDRGSLIADGSEVAGEVVERERSIVHELHYNSLHKIEKPRGQTFSLC